MGIKVRIRIASCLTFRTLSVFSASFSLAVFVCVTVYSETVAGIIAHYL